LSVIHYHKNSERPAFELTWYDDDGSLIDFSDGGYTFSLKIGTPGTAAVLTKTAGIVGAATAPNVTVSWSAGELNLSGSAYTWQLTATLAGLDRVCTGTIKLTDVIS
jgi:hypothetical protein